MDIIIEGSKTFVAHIALNQAAYTLLLSLLSLTVLATQVVSGVLSGKATRNIQDKTNKILQSQFDIINDQLAYKKSNDIREKLLATENRYHASYNEVYLAAFEIYREFPKSKTVPIPIEQISSKYRVAFRDFWLIQKQQYSFFLGGDLEINEYERYVYARFKDFFFFSNHGNSTEFSFNAIEDYYQGPIQPTGKAFEVMWRYWAEQLFKIRKSTFDEGENWRHNRTDPNLQYRRLIDNLAVKARSTPGFQARDLIRQELTIIQQQFAKNSSADPIEIVERKVEVS